MRRLPAPCIRGEVRERGGGCSDRNRSELCPQPAPPPPLPSPRAAGGESPETGGAAWPGGRRGEGAVGSRGGGGQVTCCSVWSEAEPLSLLAGRAAGGRREQRRKTEPGAVSHVCFHLRISFGPPVLKQHQGTVIRDRTILHRAKSKPSETFQQLSNAVDPSFRRLREAFPSLLAATSPRPTDLDHKPFRASRGTARETTPSSTGSPDGR